MIDWTKILLSYVGQKALSHWSNCVKKLCSSCFSPTRSGLLASVVDAGKNIRLHDIQSWAVMAEDGDPAVIEREVKCFNSGVPVPEAEQAADNAAAAAGVSGVPGNDTISGFAWHPREESVLVSVMKSGRLSKCTGESRRLVF